MKIALTIRFHYIWLDIHVYRMILTTRPNYWYLRSKRRVTKGNFPLFNQLYHFGITAIAFTNCGFNFILFPLFFLFFFFSVNWLLKSSCDKIVPCIIFVHFPSSYTNVSGIFFFFFQKIHFCFIFQLLFETEAK